MSNNKFIHVPLLDNPSMKKSIAVDGISSVEPYNINHTRIILKEVKDGNSVEVLTKYHYNDVNDAIDFILKENQK